MMNNEERMRADAAARERIVNDINTNFFVEAGAGSGKTTMLVRRMVAMVEAGADVSKICAITFTVAAANEFYDRFHKLLIERSTAQTNGGTKKRAGDLGEPTDETRARCKEALKNIDLCFTGTIDSFCNTVLSEHPSEAGIPSQTKVRQKTELTAVYRREYARIQNGEYGALLKEKMRAFSHLHKRPADVFTQLLPPFMNTRHTEVVYGQPPVGSTDELLKAEKARLIQIVDTLISRPELVYEGNNDSRKAYALLREKSELLKSPWEHIVIELASIVKGIAGLRLIPECPPDLFGPAMEDALVPHETRGKLTWYDLDPELTDKIIRTVNDRRFSVTADFLTACAKEIAAELKRRGEPDFFDELLYLRDMLKKDAGSGGKLIKHIYGRHSYFLIDEFQDTDPLQTEIFFYLTAAEPKENWRECVPVPGSLFIVGDPKQSIYRFKNADVASFLRVKTLFDGTLGEVLPLTRNFRSTHKLRRWFNEAFAQLLPEDTEEQSAFSLIPLEDEPDETGIFSGVYTYDVPYRTSDETEKDPAQTVRIIKRLVGNPAFRIKDRNTGERRTLRFKDIMLITPTKTKLGDYARAFSADGIPFRMEGEVTFADSPALGALCGIFALIAEPTDKTRLFAVLTGGAFGFARSRLYELTQKGFSLNLFADNSAFDEEAPEIVSALAELKKCVGLSYIYSSSALFSFIAEEVKIFSRTGAENAEYVYFALELLRAGEASGEICSVGDAADFLTSLVNGESGIERCIGLSSGQTDRVHIANLHKVKGLEAPVVILASHSPRKPSAEVRTEYAHDIPKTYFFALDKVATEQNADIREKENAALAAEKLRLKYVGATRARNALILGREMKKDGPRESSDWYDFSLKSEGDFFAVTPEGTPAVFPVPGTADTDALYYEGAGEKLPVSPCAGPSYELVRPSMIKVAAKSSSDDDFEDRDNDEVRSREVRRDANIVGTMVHKLMETLVSSGGKAQISAAAREISREYESGGKDYTFLLEKVGEVIFSGGYEQQNGVPRDILTELLTADEVYCEVPFCIKNEDTTGVRLVNGVIDAVYKKNGAWHIIDYKTNADPDDLDEKYCAQLNAYTEAFRALTGNTADALIYHIDVC